MKKIKKKVLELSNTKIQQPAVIAGGNYGRKTYKRTKRSRKYNVNNRKTIKPFKLRKQYNQLK